MKTILKNYSLNTTAKTITLTDIATVRLDRLALITDVTNNTILYNFADSSVSTATVSSNVITLSTMGTATNTDKLRIDYDTEATDTGFVDDIGITKLSDGTNTANVLKSDGTAAGQNAAIVSGTGVIVPYSTSTVQAVAVTDVMNYRSFSVHQTTNGTSSVTTIQGSNDNNNWVNVAANTTTSTTGVWSSNASTNSIMNGPISFRHFRLNVTGISAGTTSGNVYFSTLPFSISSSVGTTAQQSGTWTVGSNSATGSAIPANAFYIAGFDGTNLTGLQVRTPGDSVNVISGTLMTHAEAALYNGTQWDRARSNEAATLLASAARTTTQTSADLVNYNGKSALLVTLDMTTVGTGSVTVSINRKDSASGKYITILTGAAITTNSTNVYKVGPDITAVANAIAQDYLGRTFQIVVTANNANSATYSVGYELVR